MIQQLQFIHHSQMERAQQQYSIFSPDVPIDFLSLHGLLSIIRRNIQYNHCLKQDECNNARFTLIY
jgi:hypothetical protein